jgi:hypothetical protein
MDWLRSENLKEVKVVAAPRNNDSRLDEIRLIQIDLYTPRTQRIMDRNG